jgi:hypothetical protein
LGDGRVVVKKDGEIQVVAENGNEAFRYILDHQGQSVPWACAYEGWSVEDEKQIELDSNQK